MFEIPASFLAWLYTITQNYALAIGLIAVVVMLLVTPLILKSTRGMLEMQRIAPEMRKLQNEHRDDRQKLNEEMMKLYQEHKVNPMASCLPLLAQMPIFLIMFRILTGMTWRPTGGSEVVARAVFNAGGVDPGQELGFFPRYLSTSSELYESLVRQDAMDAFGLDLSLSASEMLGQNFVRGLVYAAIVAFLGGLYFFQQRMVAARAAVSPTMSPSQQKLMQYLPVMFAVFQIFFLLGLVIYYIVQSVLRILQQVYITRRFYGHDEALGRQAQQASERAREMASKDGGGGPLAQARRDLADARKTPKAKDKAKANDEPEPSVRPSKRTTPPKNRPTPAGSKRTTPPKNRPTPSNKRPASRSGSSRPTSKNTKRRRK